MLSLTASDPQRCERLLHAARVSTVEFGFGQDAPAEAESVLPVADIECRHWRMMGYLQKNTSFCRCFSKQTVLLTSQRCCYLFPNVKCFAVGLLVKPHAAKCLSYNGIVRLLQSLWVSGRLRII